MIGSTDELDIRIARIGGTEVNYYIVCPRKLWFFSHGIEMEKTSDRVALGRLLHEESYPRGKHREMMIDNLLRIDFDESNGTVHEIKLSRALERAHIYQLLYYLYYLKAKGIQGLTGVINYTKSKRIEKVYLTPEAEAELEMILAEARKIKTSRTCPEARYTRKCRKCSYEDLCWR